MTLHFGERTSDDVTVRCRQCGHGIVLQHGGVVPRCYCGCHEFDEGERRRVPRDARSPQPSGAQRDAPPR